MVERCLRGLGPALILRAGEAEHCCILPVLHLGNGGKPMKNIAHLSEGDLLELCKKHDERAWTELVERHQHCLRRTMRRLLRQRQLGTHSVEDLTQMVWVALLRKDSDGLRCYQQQRSGFHTYLQKVAKQVIESIRRLKCRRRAHEVPLEHHDQEDCSAEDGLVQAKFAEYQEGLSPQENRCLHEKLLRDAEEAAKPPMSVANEQVLKHRLRQKWGTYFDTR
jgi:RNA polymerase sigma factor (sigma-70 family)